MNGLLPFALQMLKANGEFYPYAGALGTKNEVIGVNDDYPASRPPAAALITRLKKKLCEQARDRRLQATALFYNASIEKKTGAGKSDAIAVCLDHRDGYSVTVFFPYCLDGSDLNVGGPIAKKGGADIFSAL
ncbi:MAG: hypothetical protein WA668_12020 [Candidatus Cybelea sp.]